MITPWGETQSIDMIARGASEVYTATHDGIAITDAYARKHCIPEEVLRIAIHTGKHYWFSGNGESSALFYFDYELKMGYYYMKKRMGSLLSLKQFEDNVKRSVERWHPELLEKEKDN